MRSDLATFQRRFAEAVLTGSESEFDHWPGFAVYRNNSVVSAVEALGRAYPTVRKIMGDAHFREVALGFFRAHPPRSAVLAEYGAGFADRLEPISRFTPLPLADLARIDRMRVEAHLSVDPQSDAHMRRDDIGASDWMTMIAVVHPATRFQWFATTAPSAWLALRNRSVEEIGTPTLGSEGALITRAAGEANVIRIDRLEYLLLAGLAEGGPVGPTAIALAVEHPDFDLGAAFRRLLESGAFLRFDEQENFA
jgi:hypothetical protein